MPKPSDLLQGTLDLLILRSISREPLHGWGIALGRPAKFYSLTRAGRKQLAREVETWDRLSSAVRLLLERA